MAGWGLIAIRFALYADLLLLVGLSAFPLYSLTRAERKLAWVQQLGILLAWLAVAGLLFSVIGLAVATAAMMDVSLTALDVSMLASIVTETALGTAWSVRLAALAAVLAGFFILRRSSTAMLALSLAGGSVALATLLWSGHAGATEGVIGGAHRISDIAHMVAAALWLGGIASFCLLLFSFADTQDENHVALVARTLDTFSLVGTAAVVIVVITGLFNRVAISGADVPSLVQSRYGLLLTAKVLLVGAMLALAANNRWKLTPALGRALCREDTSTAWRRLRMSVGLEAAAGATVLILVAWLGTLSAG